MAVSLAACGGSTSSSEPAATEAATEAAATEAAAEGETTAEAGNIEERHFVITGGYNDVHGYNADAQAYIKLLVDSSEGKYTYDFYNGGSLVPFLNEYDALKEGTNDITISLDPLVNTHTPYSEVFMLPIISGDAVQITKAAQAVYKSDVEIDNGRTYYQHDFEDNGIKAFPYSACTPYMLSFSKNFNEVKSAADIKSTMRIRSVTRTNNIFLEQLGVTPVTLTMNEIYDAFSKNSVDGMVGCATWKSMGIEEYAGQTIYDAPLGSYVSVFAMTTDTWNSLDDVVKERFEAAYEQTMIDLVSSGDQGWEAVFKDNWETVLPNGATQTSLKDMDQDFQDLFNEAAGNTWLEWIKAMSDQGLNGEGMAKLWRDALIEQGCQVPEAVMNL